MATQAEWLYLFVGIVVGIVGALFLQLVLYWGKKKTKSGKKGDEEGR